MAAALKRKQIRMYLDDVDEQRLQALAKAIPVLSQAMIVSSILSAGLKACSDAGNRLPLPLTFRMSEGAEREPNTPLSKGGDDHGGPSGSPSSTGFRVY